jgi:hypothetical protein
MRVKKKKSSSYSNEKGRSASVMDIYHCEYELSIV